MRFGVGLEGDWGSGDSGGCWVGLLSLVVWGTMGGTEGLALTILAYDLVWRGG